ncbi:MAG TPA: MFS transporter [Myxococcales bacterium]|nr:MFS transporter [Myxococcales bacterium]
MSEAAAARGSRTDPALLAIVGEGLFSRLAFGVLSFALPLYARSLGLSLAEVGVLMSINSAVAIGLKPVLGWTADRFGPRRTLVVAATLRSLVSLLLVFSSAPWQLFAIRSLHGVSMALRDPAANVLLADRGGSKKVASAFAWYQTGKTVAGSTSKACAGILMGLLGTRYPIIFLAGFALSALPLLVVIRYVKEVPPAPRAPARAPAQDGEPARPEPGTGMRPVLAVAGLGVLVASSAEMLAGLFPVLATEYAGLTKTQTGLVYAASTVVAVSAGPVFGWLSDNVSRKLVLGIRGAANTISSLLYVVSPSFAGVGFARCADDLGTAAFRPAWGALMSQVSHLDRSKRARVMSWLSMGEDAGGVLGPMLAGFLWNGWGVVALMSTRVLLAAASELYAFAVIRTTVPPPQPEPVRDPCALPC